MRGTTRDTTSLHPQYKGERHSTQCSDAPSSQKTPNTPHEHKACGHSCPQNPFQLQTTRASPVLLTSCCQLDGQKCPQNTTLGSTTSKFPGRASPPQNFPASTDLPTNCPRTHPAGSLFAHIARTTRFDWGTVGKKVGSTHNTLIASYLLVALGTTKAQAPGPSLERWRLHRKEELRSQKTYKQRRGLVALESH
jgi:hypothetical protein